MKCIQVMKQENKYILKMIDRLQEISMEAHEMRKLETEELSNCIEFIQQYIVDYQHIKQEKILFEETRRYVDQNIVPFIEEMLQLHGIGETYFNQLEEAYNHYKEGKFLAIYDIINNAVAYGKLVRKSIEKEENFYEYVNNVLSPTQKEQIDFKVAYFHKLKEEKVN